MGNPSEGKLKILYLKDFLLERTDENHPARIDDMISFLEEKYIFTEKKSVFRDLNTLGKARAARKRDELVNAPDSDEKIVLEDYGLNIEEKVGNYYVALKDRPFNLQEVKLLVDMVESSASIPEQEAKAIIEKLKSLTSIHEGRKLERHIGLRNPASEVDTVFRRNSDTIFQAIREKKAITFRYYRYVLKGEEKVKQHRDKTYSVSPMSLVWVDQNYYMMAYDHNASDEDSRIKTYRVDRMDEVAFSNEKYRGSETYYKLIDGNLSEYLNKIFHMFGGESRMVRMRFRNILMDAVIDRFGMNVPMHKDGEDHFIVNAEVIISPQFYGWLAGFGRDAELLAPESEREKMKQHLLDAAGLYTESE